MRLVEAADPVFARHETFHPRYGWFRKAYNAVQTDPRIFVQPDAPVQMGVGKNMVRAIRFWGEAAKLLEQDPGSRSRRSASMVSTDWGNRLFGKNGWDPYLEVPGTLWLLHWLLLASPCRLPVWWIAFNEFHAIEFTDRELERVALSQIENVAKWRTPHKSSIRKDVRALLRTYAPDIHSARARMDDILNSPFRELAIIGCSKVTNQYRFAMGAKSTLPAAVVAFAAVDYVARTSPESRTVTISHLARVSGGPGKAFKIRECELQEALASRVAAKASINLTTVAGTPQLSWRGDPSVIAIAILDDFYELSRGRVTSDEFAT